MSTSLANRAAENPAAELRQTCLYEGIVRHTRFTPVLHRFRYPIAMAYLDLDEVESRGVEELRPSWLSPASFHASDHAPLWQASGVTLSDAARALAGELTGVNCRGPVRLLTQLRWWGYYFSPLNLYYLSDDPTGAPVCLLAEVSNTPWNQRHYYAHALRFASGKCRFVVDKAFHVSPFLGMEYAYHWLVNPPGERLFTRIESVGTHGRVFEATMALHRKPLSHASVRWAAARKPLSTAQLMAAIYWQAFRLWRKKCPYYPHPNQRNTPANAGPATKP